MKWERISGVFKSLLPSSSNWSAVLLSIGAATIFWLFNSLNQNYTASINYPIQFDFPRDNYVIMENLPEEVQINVSGGGWDIFRKTFAFNLPPATILLEYPADVKKMVGTVLLPAINEHLNDLRVNYIITDTLDINIERKKSKKVAINIDSATISLEPNFKITSSLMASPDSVTVVGPESIISQLPERLPMAIEDKDIDEDFDEFVTFKIRGYNQPLLKVIPPDINVQFTVDEFVTLNGDIAVHPINFPEKVHLADSLFGIKITIKKAEQGTLVLDSIYIEANYDNIRSDSTIIPELNRYPENIFKIELDTTALKVGYE